MLPLTVKEDIVSFDLAELKVCAKRGTARLYGM